MLQPPRAIAQPSSLALYSHLSRTFIRPQWQSHRAASASAAQILPKQLLSSKEQYIQPQHENKGDERARKVQPATKPKGDSQTVKKYQDSQPRPQQLTKNVELYQPPKPKAQSYQPRQLDRPLGQAKPPAPGENSGIDYRTWRQRRDDFLDYDKHLERRKYLKTAVSKPYFQEWSNMRFHEGKSFLSNPKLFRADRALYFPNLQGRTLVSPRKFTDTTPSLLNKISLIRLYSGAWAENQTSSFWNDNPDLDATLEDGKGVAQRVDVNLEDNVMRNTMIRMFMPLVRRKLPKDMHERYFVVRRGFAEDLRDDIGFLNSKVGYIYLLDWDCKIRWAGSGPAADDEKEGLVKGMRKLLEDWRYRRPFHNDDVAKSPPPEDARRNRREPVT